MPGVIAKLFREPNDADSAINELKAKGYDVEVIRNGADLVGVALAESGLSEEALSYYRLGLALGGMVVRVSTDESKADEARKILRVAGSKPLTERAPQWANSPGFAAASRMSSTNPVDAPMSGDFRKY